MSLTDARFRSAEDSVLAIDDDVRLRLAAMERVKTSSRGAAALLVASRLLLDALSRRIRKATTARLCRCDLPRNWAPDASLARWELGAGCWVLARRSDARGRAVTCADGCQVAVPSWMRPRIHCGSRPGHAAARRPVAPLDAPRRPTATRTHRPPWSCSRHSWACWASRACCLWAWPTPPSATPPSKASPALAPTSTSTRAPCSPRFCSRACPAPRAAAPCCSTLSTSSGRSCPNGAWSCTTRRRPRPPPRDSRCRS
jgi:hypothetical protein